MVRPLRQVNLWHPLEQGAASKTTRRNDVGYFIRDARRSQQVLGAVVLLLPAVQCSNVEAYYLAVQA